MLAEVQAELTRDAKTEFEERASNPGLWLGYSVVLGQGARRLWDDDRVDSIAYRFGMSLVASMLAGLAIEVLAKGLRVQQDPAVGSTFRGKPGHDLVTLVGRTKVPITPKERAGLRHLTGFVEFAGRYPIRTGPDGLVPTLKLSRTGRLMIELPPAGKLTSDVRPTFEALYDRLNRAFSKRARKKNATTQARQGGQ